MPDGDDCSRAVAIGNADLPAHPLVPRQSREGVAIVTSAEAPRLTGEEDLHRGQIAASESNV